MGCAAELNTFAVVRMAAFNSLVAFVGTDVELSCH